MEPLSIQEVKEAVRGNFESLPEDEHVTGVSTDTRTIAEKDLFIALSGPHFDGHNFIAEAGKKGASAVICRKGSADDVPVCRIGVTDTLQSLGDLAAHYRKKFRTHIVAVTGSNGKTTVKDMIRHVLSSFSATVKSEKSYNNLVGLPLSIFRLDAHQRFAVLEMGTNMPGEISKMSRIARPQIAVITCVCETHLEKLGDIDGVASAKAEIVHGMDENGLLIVNGDDEHCLAIARRFDGKKVTFGFGGSNDVRAVKVEKRGMRTMFELTDGTVFDLPLLGAHNVLNALACITVCLRTGMTKEAVAENMSTFVTQNMRSRVISSNGMTLVNDCYNANPASFHAAIDILMSLDSSRRVLVCGDMMELGSRSDWFHKELGQFAAHSGVDVLVCVGNAMRSAGQAASADGIPESNVFFFETSDEAAAAIAGLLKKGDAVLVKGSRMIGMEVVTDAVENMS